MRVGRREVAELLALLLLLGAAATFAVAVPTLLDGEVDEPPAATRATAGDPATAGVARQYDEATVRFVDESGTALGRVQVGLATTRDQRIQGLSGVDSLPPDAGLLFVYEATATRTFVMREMRFPLDVVFVGEPSDAGSEGPCEGADGRVTTIHHAPVPPENASELTPYEGEARWVLEVTRGWANESAVTVGDCVHVDR